MKRQFDLCIFLCIAFSVSTAGHLVSYLTLHGTHDLINLCISAFAVIFFAVLKFITRTDLVYILTYGDIFYKYGDNVFEKGIFISKHTQKDKFLLQVCENDEVSRYLFKNQYAEFYFDLLNAKNGCKIVVIDNKRIKLSKIAKQNKVDLWINDHTKNTQHLNANFECIPLTNLPDNVTVTYSSNKRYAVVVRLSGQKYLLSEYTLIFENTFLKPQDIILDLQRWYHDFRDGEEVFDNEQSAILRTNQLINEYQSNNP